jgi:hypothetical protein
MNYRTCYMHLSTKLNDNVYKKIFILEFSLSMTVRKSHSLAFIKNDLPTLIYIYVTFNRKCYGRRQTDALSLTQDCEKACQLKYCSYYESSGLGPPSSQSVTHSPSHQETWQLDQRLQQKVQKRVSGHTSDAEYNCVVQDLGKCSET